MKVRFRGMVENGVVKTFVLEFEPDKWQSNQYQLYKSSRTFENKLHYLENLVASTDRKTLDRIVGLWVPLGAEV